MSPPTFFYSHARQDRETPGKLLVRFFEDLEKTVAQYSGVDLDEEKLGTIDMRIQQGSDWDANLSGGLASNKVFIAILTPLYFSRPNCGKEVATFVMRSTGLGIDQNGALTGVQNMIPIRWLPQNVYASSNVRDSLIPAILRRIEDTPADDGQDTERTAAIERYRKKGMNSCVTLEPYYGELLNLFAVVVRDMAPLPAAQNVQFATAQDAFRYDWRSHFQSVAPAAAMNGAAPAVAMTPRPLSSLVVFYVTTHAVKTDPQPVGFADSLIAETPANEGEPDELAFDELLADVRNAGVAEGFTVFQAISGLQQLAARLAELSKQGVLTALMVAPAVWPLKELAEADTVDSVVQSTDWVGPVLVPDTAGLAAKLGQLEPGQRSPRLVVLPPGSTDRVTALRRAFIDSRGQLLRAATQRAADSTALPLLKSATKAQ